jgi:hypothetical protein
VSKKGCAQTCQTIMDCNSTKKSAKTITQEGAPARGSQRQVLNAVCSRVNVSM